MTIQKVTIELQEVGETMFFGSIKREGKKYAFVSFSILSDMFTASGYNHELGIIVHDPNSSETFDDFIKAVFSV